MEPKDLFIGKQYKLAEIVGNRIVSEGEYLLVSVDVHPGKSCYPVLCFSKAMKGKQKIFLVGEHPSQFSTPLWRRAFKVGGK